MLPKIYCAVDTGKSEVAMDFAGQVASVGVGLKLGLEIFNMHGPQSILALREKYPQLSIFLDLKYHDIPNTVAGAMRSIAQVEPDYLNVHASGGLEMMQAAKNALEDESAKLGIKTPKLLAVTVLTSMDDTAVTSVGWQLPIADQVKRLAKLTQTAGLDGVVCSPLEIKIVREACGPDFVTMVPGIRPAASNDHDQKRVMTPKEAIAAGATHLVIGRPITQAADPAQAARDILASL